MKPLTPTRYLALLAALAFALTGVVALVNWVADPLNFYRMPRRAPYFSEQARYRNPGLARNADYEAVFVGTSVSLGFARPGALNLAMQGASAHEQALMLEVALGTGRARRVVWDLNYEFFRGRPDWVSDYDGPFPANFYDTNPWNEVPRYLLNYDVAKISARVLLGRYPRRGLDDMTQLRAARPPGLPSVRAAYERARAGSFVFKTQPAEFAPALPAASFDANCLAILRAHPEVQFDLHFPAFSVAYHALVREVAPGAFESMLAWKADVALKVAALPNVRLHDFQGMREIVRDFDRYTDTVHCDARTHALLMEALADGSQLATPERLAGTAEFMRANAVPEWAGR